MLFDAVYSTEAEAVQMRQFAGIGRRCRVGEGGIRGIGAYA